MDPIFLGAALGVFLCNWVVTPLFTDYTHMDGFLIGSIAATCIMVVNGIVRIITYLPLL